MHLPDVVLADGLDVLVRVGPFEEVHNDFEAENDVNNVLDLDELLVADVGALENESAEMNGSVTK